LLTATAFERLMLPAGRIVDVPKATPSFSVWRGEQPAERYGKKPVLDFEGRMAFAELAILMEPAEVGLEWSMGGYVSPQVPRRLLECSSS
jgi:hypothetical protein